MFQAFADNATQLNDTTSSWGLTLAHQFHAALPPEYQEDIEANDVNHYKIPDPATLVTKAKQLETLLALGMDVSTNTIFGLPTLSAFKFIMDLKNLSAFSPIMKETFQLTRSAGSLGLPAGIQFDLEDLRRQYEAAQIRLIVGDPEELNGMRGTFGPATTSVDDVSQGYLRRSVVDVHHYSG